MNNNFLDSKVNIRYGRLDYHDSLSEGNKDVFRTFITMIAMRVVFEGLDEVTIREDISAIMDAEIQRMKEKD